MYIMVSMVCYYILGGVGKFAFINRFSIFYRKYFRKVCVGILEFDF